MASLNPITLVQVTPFDKGSAPQSVRNLSPIECAHLLHAFAQDKGAAPKDSPAYEVLEELFTRHLWLGCSCKGGTLATAPVLYVQSTRSFRRPFTVVRNHSRGMHDANCPFSRASKPKGSSLAIRTKSQSLGVLRKAAVSSTSGTVPKIYPSSSKADRIPSIANVLFTILEHAGCNRLLGISRSVTSDAEMINKALSSFFMDAKKKIPALEYFGTNLHKFDAVARRVARAARQKEWPANIPPHGFVIGLCELQRDKDNRMWLVEPRRGITEPKRWQVTGHVRLSGPGTPGPNVAIGLIAVPSGNQQPELVQAYVHPANSFNELMLVDSDLERQTLAILTKHLTEMKERGMAYSVSKPYLDITGVKSGATFRPDFIVMKNGKTRYIETMGYDDPEYLLRKGRVHQAMRREHRVLEHVPSENDKQFRADIEEFIGYV